MRSAGCVLPSVGVALMLTAACSRSNNVLLGRVEALVGGHTVVVTDCYRTSVPAPQQVAGPGEYRWTPCRDADIFIRGGALTVNGVAYGTLAPADTITVDHGKVLINEVEARATARR
jgi:hypothetical protein